MLEVRPEKNTSKPDANRLAPFSSWNLQLINSRSSFYSATYSTKYRIQSAQHTCDDIVIIGKTGSAAGPAVIRSARASREREGKKKSICPINHPVYDEHPAANITGSCSSRRTLPLNVWGYTRQIAWKIYPPGAKEYLDVVQKIHFTKFNLTGLFSRRVIDFIVTNLQFSCFNLLFYRWINSSEHRPTYL